MVAIPSVTLSASAVEARTLRLGIITPPPHKWTKTAATIAKALQQETDGALELAIFPSGQLGNEAQMLQLLQTGAIDFAFLTTSELANRLIEFSAFYTPYIAKNASHAACILRGTVSTDILKTASKIGVTGMGYGMAGMRQIVSRQKIKQPEDLKGLKVRVTADLPLTDFWKLAGAAPTAIPLSALYDAFANGQIDAMHIDFENTLRLKFYKHAQAVLHSDHMIFPMVALASTKSWQTLSDTQRALIQRLFDTHLNALLNSYASADSAFKKSLIAQGVQVDTIPQSFFTDVAKAWSARWQKRTPFVAALKAEAETMSSKQLCAGKNREPKSDR